MTSFISVIFPVYNAELYLREAVDSILGQTYGSFELIALNDGSIDQSLQILKSYKDERLRILNSEENKGLVCQLNHGIKNAKGDYILRMDADDICEPDRFEKQIEYMETHSEVGICGTYVKVFGERNWNWRMPLKDDLIRFSLLFGATFCHPSVIIRKSILDSYNLSYSEKAFPIEDYDLWLRILKHTQGANLPFFLTKYRYSGDQITSKNNSVIREKIDTLAKSEFEKYFFNVDEKDELSYKILVGASQLSLNNYMEFSIFMKKVDNMSKLDIPKRILKKELDRLHLMRIVNLKKIMPFLHFLISRHQVLRVYLSLKSVVTRIFNAEKNRKK